LVLCQSFKGMAVDESDPLEFLVTQLKGNVEFLEKKGRLSKHQAHQIASLLASSPSTAPPPHVESPQVVPQFVRALYDYNTPGDLNFRTGDVIELVPSANDNDDWWRGRLNGHVAIFPSNHVEKIPGPVPPYNAGPAISYNEKAPTHSFNDDLRPSGYPGGYQAPNGYQGAYPTPAPYQSAPPPTTVVYQQPPGPEDPKKKSKLSKIGGTVGTAAAGGLGFGAGTAVGSGIINAIF